jgi:hypothetical protein
MNQTKLSESAKPGPDRKRLAGLTLLLFLMLSAITANAQTTSFSYQGRLTDGGSAATGNYDLQFSLWNSASGGSQVGSTLTMNAVAVRSGIFTVSLDFGAGSFSGPDRFLEIGARSSSGGAFTLLTPRQPVSATPYAIRSLIAGSADNATTATTAANASQLGGVAANQFVQTSDSRLSDLRPPSAGSANYIQNSNTTQAGSNFSISGNGTAGGTVSANVVNASTQYNLNGNRAFAITGAGEWANTNTFAGVGAGVLTTTSSNSDAGSNNSFFGSASGAANTIGSHNAFFGTEAGKANTTGGANSFFGRQAGFGNTTGDANTFVGNWAGITNTTGAINSFFGHRAGWHNTTGSNNVMLGYSAGQQNTTGNSNAFVGAGAGGSNVTGNFNTYLGTGADGTADITNATAIGANAKVTQSNSLVLGTIDRVVGDTFVGIGTTAPQSKLHVYGADAVMLRVEDTVSGGKVASFGGFGDFQVDSNGIPGGRLTIKESGDTGIGTFAPLAKLDVRGKIRTTSLGSGGSIGLCLNSSAEISSCSSSLRYKTSLRPFTGGLNLVNRLHPITFKWKSDQTSDLGLGAEDVAAVEPLLVTRNANGEVEGVKYDRVTVVLLNAVKEQQTQIARQQAEIRELKQLVCSSRRKARVCR